MRRAFFFLACALTLAAAPGLRLEGEPFQPYRLNHATVADEDGLQGDVVLTGLAWDGRRVPLFRTRLEARSPKADLLFYLDEELRSLELRSGDRSLAVDLSGQAPDEAQRRMRALAPPVHLVPDGEDAPRLSLTGADLVLAGYQASALFALPFPWTPLALLGAFAVLSLALSALPWRGKGPMAAGLALLATLGILAAARPRSTLFRAALPAGGPEARISGVLERRISAGPDFQTVAYEASPEPGADATARGKVELVGLWTPAGPGIPVAEVVPPGARVRFSAPPMVEVGEGEACFRTRDFVTGWVFRD